MNEKKVSSIPVYSSFVYGDRYNSITASETLDTAFSARLRTFFQYDKLVASALRNIKMNQNVLQMGLVFGNEIDQVAQTVGAYGQYDIIDVNPFQVSRNQEKYGSVYPCLHIFEQDAATLKVEKKYDVVLCFLLLQELPVVTKMKVVNNALNAVKDGGCAVFIDYHNPLYWHPLRYVVRMYNRLRHPFAEKLWDREIDTFAKNKIDFVWRKSTCFGRMFQKVVATRKNGIGEVASAEAQDATLEDYFLPDF